VPARQAHHAFRLGSGLEEPLAQPDGRHAVALAVQDQDRRLHGADDVDGRELVAHEEAHGQPGIEAARHVRGGCEGRVQDQAAHRPLGGEAHGDAGAQRFAVEDDSLGLVALRHPCVGGSGVRVQPRLGGRARRARIAAVAHGQHAAPALQEGADPEAPIIQASAIAVEIKDHGAPGPWWAPPPDQSLAVGRGQHHVLHALQPGLRRARLLRGGGEQERTLAEKQGHEDDEVEGAHARRENDESFHGLNLRPPAGCR
jgi:hypothetical protein